MRAKFSLTVLLGMILISSSAVAQYYGRFPDVRPEAYYARAVDRLAYFGIFQGYRDGRFHPNDAVTRGQLAVVLDRYDAVMVDPLREMIRDMRAELDLGLCGNNRREVGEQCDDGNTQNGDGCSAYCFNETVGGTCSAGHRVGDSYPSDDGCNTCSCTVSGEVCTLRACDIRTCYGSEDCSSNQYCTTETGDCRSNCPPGQYCPAVCSGICINRSSSSSSSSRSEINACRDERDEYEDLLAESRSCVNDAECEVFSYSCPFVTCGEAVRQGMADDLAALAHSITQCRQSQGEPVACASCVRQKARCVSRQCVLVQY